MLCDVTLVILTDSLSSLFFTLCFSELLIEKSELLIEKSDFLRIRTLCFSEQLIEKSDFLSISSVLA
jgi:hypothetical protein